MSLELLQSVWFLLLFILLIGYAILDGFDLGVGAWYPFIQGEQQRRMALNAIGPVWDGNEVWLLTAGGAIFAAFPVVYATVFSGLYIALMLLLAALIARAVAMEFRSKIENSRWRAAWDAAFVFGSAVPALLLGVAFGNILRGLPIDAEGAYTGSFLSLLNPYALLIGVLTLCAFAVHGGIFLANKADEAILAKIRRALPALHTIFIVLYVVATVASVWVSPFLFEKVADNPLAWACMAGILAGLYGTARLIRQQRYSPAFATSSLTIGSMIGMAAVNLFPRLVPSRLDLAHSLTIANSSSTRTTLLVMLIIALIGMPLVLAYTLFVYRAFKGKVVLTADSY